MLTTLRAAAVAILALLGAASHSTALAQEFSCTQKGYVIGYFNGVLTTFVGAGLSLIRLREESFAPYPSSTYKNQPIKYRRFYNPTGGPWADVAEAFRQKYRESPTVISRWEHIWAALYGHRGFESLLGNDEALEGRPIAALFELPVIDDIRKSIVLTARNFTQQEIARANPSADTQKLIAQMQGLIDQKWKVLAVAHSQGNLFVNRVYEAVRPGLIAQQVEGLRVVHVATVASKVSKPDQSEKDDDYYTNNSNDIVVNSVRNLLSNTLGYNVTVPFHGSVLAWFYDAEVWLGNLLPSLPSLPSPGDLAADPTGHFFDQTYMDTRFDAYSDPQKGVRAHLEAALARLQDYPCPTNPADDYVSFSTIGTVPEFTNCALYKSFYVDFGVLATGCAADRGLALDIVCTGPGCTETLKSCTAGLPWCSGGPAPRFFVTAFLLLDWKYTTNEYDAYLGVNFVRSQVGSATDPAYVIDLGSAYTAWAPVFQPFERISVDPPAYKLPTPHRTFLQPTVWKDISGVTIGRNPYLNDPAYSAYTLANLRYFVLSGTATQAWVVFDAKYQTYIVVRGSVSFP